MTRIDVARVRVLRSPSRLASSEITAPMDRFAEHRGRRASWYGSMQPVLVELGVDGLDDAPIGIAVTQGGAATAAVLAEHLLPLAMGRPLDTIDDVDRLWDRLRLASLPYGSDGLAAMARSAIDLAAWDLLGRLRGEPVVRLLGGTRRPLPVYATGNDIVHHRQLGLRTSKVGLQTGPWHDDGLRRAITQVEQARRTAGDEHCLMVDGWMGLDLEFVRSLAPALRDADALWLEEPLPPDAIDELRPAVTALGDVLLATGEHATSVQELTRIVRAGAHVVQPDLAWCGGITALRRLLPLLPDDIEVAPHLSGTAWGVHAAAAFPQVRRVEWYVESEPGEAIDAASGPVRGGPVPVGGMIRPGDQPGLGIEIDIEHVDRWADDGQTIDARHASFDA